MASASSRWPEAGLQSVRGEIGLFRYPGSSQAPTGDVVGEIASGAPGGHTDTVMSLAFDPRGRFLASASMDHTVRLWDLTTRTSVALVGHTGPVNVVAYLPDGRRLVSAGADGLVKLWDADRRVLLATAALDPRNGAAQNVINAMAVSPDGRWVVLGRDGEAWSATTPPNSAIRPTVLGARRLRGPSKDLRSATTAMGWRQAWSASA